MRDLVNQGEIPVRVLWISKVTKARYDQDFTDYLGYRYIELQRLADICADAARKGETNIALDCDDLTEDELRCLEKEVGHRLSRDGC